MPSTPENFRPTVKVVKGRFSQDAEPGTGSVLIYVEGVAGQRARIFVSSRDEMGIHIEHDDTCRLEVREVKDVRWHDQGNKT